MLSRRWLALEMVLALGVLVALVALTFGGFSSATVALTFGPVLAAAVVLRCGVSGCRVGYAALTGQGFPVDNDRWSLLRTVEFAFAALFLLALAGVLLLVAGAERPPGGDVAGAGPVRYLVILGSLPLALLVCTHAVLRWVRYIR